MTIVESESRDPLHNFALERSLVEQGGDCLLLYINSPCVVVGRNQQPEAEADLEYCAREGIPVLRRVSGGGSVWHDEGNVNFAFITGADDEKPLGRIIEALGEMGIEAVAGPRGEIVAGGGKISGTASWVKRGRRLFHGTLLWDSDMERMRRALAGDPAARGRGVASVPSKTVNMATLVGDGGTAAEFMKRLAAVFARQEKKN